MSECEAIETPATLQTESVAKPVAVFWMSCLEQICLAIGETMLFISLSMVWSVQCCMVISGKGEPVLTILTSHRPALRSGRSSAHAQPAGAIANRQKTKPPAASLHVIDHAPTSTKMAKQCFRSNAQ